ncbi:MraY family glycosyltransferase [Pseudoxanthomonas koreensis]|uniref:MraY family glycosyltransferase n=1 Tax=Pseudoxanthomonas koreensis TaxID=266061 RepID=UPI0013919E1C|nr:glycosyltransferase family 4 protein [Pseudoxanthomonas koreensis]KAF1691084.1 glycosyl transferase [Pseudoxanthomonas koreensis]
MALATWLALHAGVSALATGCALAYARRRNLVDQPGERRSHTVPTPRGGGIGIAVALLAGCAAVLAAGTVAALPVLAFATGLLLVAGIGWIDDHRPLSPGLRLGVQWVAGLVLAWGLFGADGRWAWALFAAVLVPVLVNVWNFMDGIDGLATSQAILAALGLAALAPAAGVATLALAAACVAFLPFNFPRARIFLGDVGSGTLGYALAALVALAADDVGGQRLLLVLLPLSAFLVDASLTLASRMLARERWWLPHTSHLYQRWVKAGRSHVFVTSVYGAFSLIATILAWFLGGCTPLFAGGGAVLWFALAVAGWFAVRSRLDPGKGKTEDA